MKTTIINVVTILAWLALATQASSQLAARGAAGEAADWAYKSATGPHSVKTAETVVLRDAQRGKDLQLRVTWPEAEGPFPVIVWSHGATGTKDMYQPLVRHWVGHGYVCLQANHSESRALTGRAGPGIDTFADWENRPRDIAFLLDSLDEVETKVPALKGKVDRTAIGVGGHSFGAHTAQLVAGATTVDFGGARKSHADPRPLAFLLLSPQGIGSHAAGLDAQSWDGVTRPFIVITGTNDIGRKGDDWQWRLDPWKHAPRKDKFLLVIEGAWHGFGGVVGDASFRGAGPENAAHRLYVQSVSVAFWDAFLKKDRQAIAFLRSNTMTGKTRGEAKLSHGIEPDSGAPQRGDARAEYATTFEDATWRDEGRDRDVPVRIYAPKGAEGRFPVVVFSHAGGRVLHDASWSTIKVPTLVVTGTRDFNWVAAVRGNPALLRRPYDALPPGDKYLVEIADAEHNAFTDSVPYYPARERDGCHHGWICEAVTAFLDAHLKRDEAARAWLDRKELEEAAQGACRQESKPFDFSIDGKAPAAAVTPKKEVERELRERAGDGDVKSQVERMFQVFDRDRDGALSRDEMPEEPPHKKHLNLRYAEIVGVDRKLLSLDLYVPDDKQASAKRPVMIMIHGGGWRNGDKANPPIVGAKMRHFVGLGCIYATINYRLSPQTPREDGIQHPVHAMDCAAAIAWIHDHIAQYGGDPDRLHLLGHSAGGHLAAIVGTNERFLKAYGKDLSILKSSVLLDPAAIDIPRYVKLVEGRSMTALYELAFGKDEANWRDASPQLHVAPGKQIPPMLVFYAGDRMKLDVLAPAFADALTQAGSPSRAVDTVTLDHGQINSHIGMMNEPMTAVIMRLHAGEDASRFPAKLDGKPNAKTAPASPSATNPTDAHLDDMRTSAMRP